MSMSEIQAPLLPKRRIEEEYDHEDEENDEEDILRTDYGSAVYHYPPHLQHGHFSSLEKLMFFTSSILLILLFVFVGLYARSSLQDDDPILPIPIPTKPANSTLSLCHSSNCIITAAQVLQDVDQELDPCDDFYAYTCNKWQDSHSIPDSNSRIDIESTVKQSIHRRLDQILTNDFDKLNQNQDPWKLPSQDTILDKQLFRKLSEFYQSCMNQDQIENVGVQPLYDLFRNIQKFIPLNDNHVSNQQLQDAISFLADRQIWTLFELKVESDIHNPTKPSLFLWQGQVGLPQLKFYDDTNIMSAYFQMITDTLSIIFSKDTDNQFGFKYWSTIATARRIIEFERKLVHATTVSFKDPQYMERWPLDQLQSNIPNINWNQFIQNHLGDLPLPKDIMVPTAEFIDNLKKDILSTTNPRTLQMYFIWRTIWKYLDVLGSEYSTPKRQLLDRILLGIEPRSKPDRRDTCMNMINKSSLGLLMGRYYANDHQQDISTSKEKLKEFADLVVSLMKQNIQDQDIISKLDQIEFQIGYSTSEPSIQSPISLADYFSDIEIKKNDFFGNMLRDNQHQVKQAWKLLEKPTLDKQPFNAQDIKISYQRESNKVIIPAGLLQLPFFDSEGPLYLYTGTIGWMIGHEIMHGFDTIGRNYDPQGKFGNEWLNKDMQRKLDEKNECLIKQYQRYGLDSLASLNNNFADQVGLLLFETLNKENMASIPGLNNKWTKDQLTYIQFARMKCSKTTRERQLLRNEYAPDQLRINIPLMNSNHFAKVFNCKKGSFMNPDKKMTCNIW